MTPLFNSGELLYLQSVQNETMQDTAIVQSYTGSTTDSFGQPTPAYTDGSSIACGLNLKGGREITVVGDTEITKIISDATVRLPYGTTVKPQDRIKITHRFGVALASPDIFEVIQQERQGASGILVDVQKIEKE